MKKTVRVILIIIAVLIVTSAAVLLVSTISGRVSGDFNDPAQEEVLSESVDCVSYVFGDGAKFPDQFKYKRLNEINESEIDFDHDSVYLSFIDLSGTTPDYEGVLSRMLEIADAHENFNFLYIGERGLSYLAERLPDCEFNDRDKSLGYTTGREGRIKWFGYYTKDDDKFVEANDMVVADTIIYFTYDTLR